MGRAPTLQPRVCRDLPVSCALQCACHKSSRCASLLRARAPRVEQRGQIGGVDVSIGHEIEAGQARRGTPCVENLREVGRVDETVLIEVSRARGETALADVEDAVAVAVDGPTRRRRANIQELRLITTTPAFIPTMIIHLHCCVRDKFNPSTTASITRFTAAVNRAAPSDRAASRDPPR